MPIRPEMRHLYPPPAAWKKLRAEVLERAEDNCECKGECGHAHDGGGLADEVDNRCRAPNGETVFRYPLAGRKVDTWDYTRDDAIDVMREVMVERGMRPNEHVEDAVVGEMVRVVLTIAHRDHNPSNNDLSNLAAFCQRCHLRYDAREHAKNAAATRARKAGQRRAS